MSSKFELIGTMSKTKIVFLYLFGHFSYNINYLRGTFVLNFQAFAIK